MSVFEERLRSSLRDDATRDDPAPDLFARVRESIADDVRLRRQRLATVGIAAAISGALACAMLAFSTVEEGRIDMHWWILEIAATAVLVFIALWLGPFIKRFGRAYAADVFHDNPRTGKSYIVLTDIVYYLIFTAYILFTVQVESPTLTGDVDAGFVRQELVRLGGILLIIGVLHGLNIVLMPMLGRLFSLNRRLTRGSDSEADR
jgi:hypothetical protein